MAGDKEVERLCMAQLLWRTHGQDEPSIKGAYPSPRTFIFGITSIDVLIIRRGLVCDHKDCSLLHVSFN